MIIHIEYRKMQVSESLSEIITRNLRKLSHKYPFVIRARVTLKLENDPGGSDKSCHIELSAPGPRLFAKSTEDNFEKAAAAALDDLDRQLRKRKAKLSTTKKTI